MKKISTKNYAQIAADFIAAGYTSGRVSDLIIRAAASGQGTLFTSAKAFYLLIEEMQRLEKH